MRVTKTIREFIEKEVSNRLDAKYAAEKEEANFQTKVEQEARSIVNDIIVEMELGGDKATLMAMLDKVGEV